MLTLYVADIQTQTAIHSMDPTHSHQGHKPNLGTSVSADMVRDELVVTNS